MASVDRVFLRPRVLLDTVQHDLQTPEDEVLITRAGAQALPPELTQRAPDGTVGFTDAWVTRRWVIEVHDALRVYASTHALRTATAETILLRCARDVVWRDALLAVIELARDASPGPGRVFKAAVTAWLEAHPT